MTQRSLAQWLSWIEQQHPRSIELGLERVRAVARRMGLTRPSRDVITVGGTNGKGSTVAFIEAIARADGWRVGTYTSPHLLAYNERVRIHGADVGAIELVAGFEAVEAARADTPLTYFEYGTLCALWLFQRSELDLAVLEVGLGGRLDAVNIVDPDVAVITTVDLDHQDWLGNDREAIGSEKAGIARGWKPLVLGEDDPPASVLRHAYAIGASAVRANCDFFFERLDGQCWQWREPGCTLALPRPRLAAPVQLRNAATAIAALRALGESLSAAAYCEGVRDACIAGRLQRFVVDDVDVLVDVAHTPQAARELAASLRQTPTPGRTLAVFAALGDKDLGGIVDALAGVVDHWMVAGLDGTGSRGLASADFARRLGGTAAEDASVFETVGAAIAAARKRSRSGDRIVVFGSFFTAAAALQVLQTCG